MIQLRYREWDWVEWTEATLEGPDESVGLSVLGSWALVNDCEIEVLDESGEWNPLGETE